MASGDVSPMQAVIGSIAAQEVVKVRHHVAYFKSCDHHLICVI